MDNQDDLREMLMPEMAWVFTRGGAMQRSRIYEKDGPDNKRKEFVKFVKQYLQEYVFIPLEKNKTLSEDQLYELIDHFIAAVEKKFKGSGLLKDNRFQFGNAQKFINLYLKAMWVLGVMEIPPHFPVDSIIQKELYTSEKWTDMDRKSYERVIRAAKEEIEGKPTYSRIAHWEAANYFENYTDA